MIRIRINHKILISFICSNIFVFFVIYESMLAIWRNNCVALRVNVTQWWNGWPLFVQLLGIDDTTVQWRSIPCEIKTKKRKKKKEEEEEWKRWITSLQENCWQIVRGEWFITTGGCLLGEDRCGKHTCLPHEIAQSGCDLHSTCFNDTIFATQRHFLRNFINSNWSDGTSKVVKTNKTAMINCMRCNVTLSTPPLSVS